MKKRLIAFLAVAVFAGSMFGAAANAQATPGQSRRCATCHTATTAMTVTVRKTAANTYRVTAAGARGIGVFDGSRKVKGASGPGATFRTVKGHHYSVYAVNGYPHGYKLRTFVAQ